MEGPHIAFFFLLTICNLYFAASQEQVFPEALVQTGLDPNSGPSEVCIGCICEGASNCNRTLGCGGGMCGLFRITKPYWIDAGRPVIDGDDPENEIAWQRCATDPFCAGQAVLAYTGRFQKDCNNDGRIDCRDFARIHHLGGYGCFGNLDTIFERRFNSCFQSTEGK